MSPEVDSVGKGRRILLVDNEIPVRRALRRLLEAVGFQVAEAADGPTATALSDAYGDSIVLLIADIELPGLNGCDLAACLRARRPGLGVLFISGRAESDVPDSGMQLDGARFLQKPFSLASLRLKLGEVLPPE